MLQWQTKVKVADYPQPLKFELEADHLHEPRMFSQGEVMRRPKVGHFILTERYMKNGR